MMNTGPAFISMPGGSEWIWIFLIVLVLFGAAALPKLFRSFGKAMREFKSASQGLGDELDKADGPDETKKTKTETPSESESKTNADE